MKITSHHLTKQLIFIAWQKVNLIDSWNLPAVEVEVAADRRLDLHLEELSEGLLLL